MNLRDLETGERGHADFHNQERRRINRLQRQHGVFADDYDSLASALAAAVSHQCSTVYLDPTQLYLQSETLVIPDGITLHGGGMGQGFGYRATLRATTGLAPMIILGNYANLIGCTLDGNNKAVDGVLIRRNFNTIKDNWLHRFTVDGAAMKAGGALYTSFRRNIVSNSFGYGLDARDSYALDPSVVYYGINHGYSEQNIWGAHKGALYFEGLMQSVNDDIEMVLDGDAAVTIGGAASTQLHMANPYFELVKGAASVLVAISALGSSRLIINGGQIFGNLSADSIAIKSTGTYGLHIHDCNINRFQYGMKGLVANDCIINVSGNRWGNVETVNALTGLALARVDALLGVN